MAETGKGRRLDSLEAIKGIGAIIIAFVWHYQHFRPEAGSPFSEIFAVSYKYGWTMVEVFFMLSGFGMLLGYENRIIEKSITFEKYLFNRIKRVLPTMLITLVVTTVLELFYIKASGATFVYPNFDVYHFFLNGYLLQNGLLSTAWSFNSPSWCIGVLMTIYVLFYAVVAKFRKYYNELTYVYLGLGLLGCALVINNSNLPVVNILMGRGISCFFIGAVLARIYLRLEKEKHIRKSAIGHTALIVTVICYLLIRFKGAETWGNVQMTVIIGIAPMMILSVLYVPWLRWLMERKPLVYLGRLSFGIYLWHFPVQCIIENLNVYLKLDINYSSKKIWLLYACSTVLLAAVYDRFVYPKAGGLLKRIYVRKAQ